MRKKKGKQKPKQKAEPSTQKRDRPKYGGLNSLWTSGWVQNISVTALALVTASICAILGLSVLKTSVITVCVFLTALVWIVGITVIRERDTGDDKSPFAAAIETAYVGQTRDTGQLACLYNGRYFFTVPVSMFVRIVNMQDTPAKISLFKVEVESRRQRWLPSSWFQLKRISDEVPLVWLNPPPAHSVRIELIGPRLMSVLEQPIPPHSTVWGWVLFDASAEYDSAPRPIRFRISIKDTAGQRFTREDAGSNDDNIADPPRGWHSGEDVNLTGYTFRHLAE